MTEDILDIPDFLRRTDETKRKVRAAGAAIKLRRSKKQRRRKRKRPGDPAALARLGYRPAEVARITRDEADNLIFNATRAELWRRRNGKG